MSFDKTENEYHLTPSGWIDGTSRIYGSPERVVERPKDCVETWVRIMEQGQAFSKENVVWKRIWIAPDYPQSKREALEKKYPRPNY
jgi:hypothetical protein